jgi:hypothetical protein
MRWQNLETADTPVTALASGKVVVECSFIDLNEVISTREV